MFRFIFHFGSSFDFITKFNSNGISNITKIYTGVESEWISKFIIRTKITPQSIISAQFILHMAFRSLEVWDLVFLFVFFKEGFGYEIKFTVEYWFHAWCDTCSLNYSGHLKIEDVVVGVDFVTFPDTMCRFPSRMEEVFTDE